jgi:hypothetical protein
MIACLAICWFFTAFRITKHLIDKYPNTLKSKSLIEFVFYNFKEGVIFWKEMLKPSFRKDKKFMTMLFQFWILLSLAVIAIILLVIRFYKLG